MEISIGVKGIIRVSNHKVDIGTFAENNPDIDYCVSLVVGESERLFPDKDAPQDRDIHIIEYVLNKDYENKERILMNIVDRIISMKTNGWTLDANVGIMSRPFDKTNKKKLFSERRNIIISEKDLRQIIKKIIKEIINNKK